MVLAGLISWLLVEAAYGASELMEGRPYPERFDVFEFRYDPASEKWQYQP